MNASHKIVSSESEELILVDEADNETGYLAKSDCHDGAGILHRAFSLFLFNDAGQLLLQQRSDSKRLWPGFWSNSICSHPRRGESLAEATQRRLQDELNIESELEHVYRFTYQAGFGDAGSEHELCHVYLGRTPRDIHPNEHEIAAIRFVSAKDLEGEFEDRPDSLTPWFRMEWQALTTTHRARLARYAVLPDAVNGSGP